MNEVDIDFIQNSGIGNAELATKLDTIATNTANINVNVGDVEINVADLETLQALTNDKLDHLSSNLDTVNSNLNPALGNIDGELEGHTTLLTTANTNTAHISDNLDHISSDLDHISTDLDASLVKQTSIDTNIGGNRILLTDILAKNGEIETSANALISANHTDLVAIEASLTSMEGKIDVIDTVLDNSLTKQTNVETLITTLDGVQDSIFAQIYSQEQNIIAFKTANHTDIVNTKDMVSSVGTTTNNNLAHISDNLDHLSANSDTIEASLTAMEAKMDVDNVVYDNQLTKLTNNETLLTAIDADTNAIKVSAAALVVDAAATEVLITATNSLLTTLDGVQDNALTKLGEIETSADALISANHTDLVALEASLASMEGKQDTAITHLSEIEGAVETIESAIGTDGSTGPSKSVSMAGTESGGNLQELLVDSSGHLQVDVLTIPVTLADSATATNTAACATDLAALEVLSTAANVDLAAIEVLLGTIDSDTNDIKTACELLDNAVDGNFLNTNQCVAGSDVAVNSGNKGSTVPRVCIATDDIPIALVNTKLDTLIGHTDGVETVLSAIDTVLDNIKVDTNAIKVDAAATEILVTATNSLLTTLDGVQDNILVKQTLATTSEVKEFLSGATVNSGAQSAQFDTENYEKARFFGETTASVGTDIILMGSNADGGTFYVLGENLRSETIGSTHYIYGPVVENLPRYIKILNKSGSTNYIFTKLYFQGSGGRLAV